MHNSVLEKYATESRTNAQAQALSILSNDRSPSPTFLTPTGSSFKPILAHTISGGVVNGPKRSALKNSPAIPGG